MLQCVAVYCVLQCNGCYSNSDYTRYFASTVFKCVAVCCSALQCVAVRCSVLHCVAVYCSALQCVAVRCSALQCVAVCCSVLQYVALNAVCAMVCES